MAARKSTPKKRTAKAPSGKATARPRRKSARKKAPSRERSVSSLTINLGHVFALRPRAQSSFRPGDFRRAKHLLRDEKYASAEAAARAVAEKALELTREGADLPASGRRGRWH